MTTEIPTQIGYCPRHGIQEPTRLPGAPTVIKTDAVVFPTWKGESPFTFRMFCGCTWTWKEGQ